MKKILLTIILLFNITFSKEFVITKYLENKPVISIKYSGPQEVKKILDMDIKVLDHFEISNNTPYKFIFNYNKIKKTLTVEYQKDSNTILIKRYHSNTYAFFPFLVHRAVYDINEFFKLPSAKFLIRKVIYSLLVAPKEANIYLADYTLSYKRRLLAGGLNVFPKWADNKQTTIYFTRYERKPVLYKFNIYTGKKEKILSSQGMLIVSDVKDNKLLLTLAPNGQPDVYLFDLNTKKLTKITNYQGIDVNGKFWGDKIIFVSDRYGNPYVFQKDLTTGAVSRVLYHGKNQVGVDTYMDNLVISTRETANAFKPNTFNLFLVNANDDSLKRLTMNGQNMFPNFSVDGNSIMFIKRVNFSSKIGIIRLEENKVFYYPLRKTLQSFDW
ncbi:Tol-Pal system protein TolB [Caminibacter mediatlanticus TB-2]|uniref:Tol-Pal system protein TolB n=1 Tax=Caminibacter mediatlanticus TB-2 TaxID=391592 RepID=A0AAI9AIT1_9BACT|nr:Tol-Pal system protein TolB [Caminibacter mediatlanticus]EDM24417.1 translocation protein TolB precursor [Caminibacter mediatlanticus TB-2]QCT95063.1 Tol-Pal system protein TolB [Caminibacter mediatlanticus TB-2]